MKTCVSCKHLRRKGPTNIWYDLLCAKAPREVTVCPLTGESGFKGKNDLGGEYVTQDAFRYCRDINKGDCEMWEAKRGWRIFK